MSKWNMIVDVEKCHNCNNCFLSCKDEYVGNEHPGYSAPQPLHGHKWIHILSKERGTYPIVDVVFVPTMCNHCDDAPCMKVGGDAIKKRDDGIVLIDPVKAKGKKEIVDACPYGAIWWNEELEVPQAWTFDAHLLDRGWKEPRCVQGCPTGALRSVKVSDAEMQTIIQDEQLAPLVAEHNTKPRVHYKNLHRFNRLLIGAAVVGKKDGVLECVSGATVSLMKEGATISTKETDAFGEFMFDNLESNSGDYEIHISHADFSETSITTSMADESIVLETVTL